MSRTSTRTSSPDRLWALSDGVYAIAITVLVLNIDVPAGLDAERFRDALHDTGPKLLAWALSFVVIAAFWRDQRHILRNLVRTDETLTRLTLLGLGLIALMPFPTSLLSEYSRYPRTVAIYAATVAAIALVHVALVVYQRRHPQLSDSPMTAIETRFTALDFGSTALVMLASVGIALTLGTASAAQWIWLVLLPVKLLIGLARKRAQARNPA